MATGFLIKQHKLRHDPPHAVAAEGLIVESGLRPMGQVLRCHLGKAALEIIMFNSFGVSSAYFT